MVQRIPLKISSDTASNPNAKAKQLKRISEYSRRFVYTSSRSYRKGPYSDKTAIIIVNTCGTDCE